LSQNIIFRRGATAGLIGEPSGPCRRAFAVSGNDVTRRLYHEFVIKRDLFIDQAAAFDKRSSATTSRSP